MKHLGFFFLKLMGWKMEDTIPREIKTFALIAAPHTSNMDFFVALPCLWALDIKFAYLIKKELFWWPLGAFLRGTGGIPVDRSGTNKKFVAGLTNRLKDADQLALLFTPEGTRSFAKRWKTGFYRIAHSLDVPVIMATADYEKKLVTVGAVFHPTGNVEADLAAMEKHYEGISAKYPEKFNKSFFIREK